MIGCNGAGNHTLELWAGVENVEQGKSQRPDKILIISTIPSDQISFIQ
jgi:hypothetical protein